MQRRVRWAIPSPEQAIHFHQLSVRRGLGQEGRAPPFDALLDGCDGCEGVEAQLEVKLAAAEVVNNADLVTAGRQVQGGGPATVAVAA